MAAPRQSDLNKPLQQAFDAAHEAAQRYIAAVRAFAEEREKGQKEANEPGHAREGGWCFELTGSGPRLDLLQEAQYRLEKWLRETGGKHERRRQAERRAVEK
jgi:hypothetical protein